MPERVAMERSFVTVDVFTDRRFGGNPLAVVLDAQGLETATCKDRRRVQFGGNDIRAAAEGCQPYGGNEGYSRPARSCRLRDIRT